MWWRFVRRQGDAWCLFIVLLSEQKLPTLCSVSAKGAPTACLQNFSVWNSSFFPKHVQNRKMDEKFPKFGQQFDTTDETKSLTRSNFLQKFFRVAFFSKTCLKPKNSQTFFKRHVKFCWLLPKGL
jgi:hypothetical protein